MDIGKIISEIINYVLLHKQLSLTVISSFGGAFFAFCFFILGEVWRSYRERQRKWFKTYLNMHAYLDRYLQYLFLFLHDNTVIQKNINNQYKQNQLTLQNLNKLPVVEDASMKLADMAFLNKVENLKVSLKKLNIDIETFNDFKNKMNDRIEKFLIELKRDDIKKMIANNLTEFLRESQVIINYHEMLKEDVLELEAENMFLYHFYKKRFISKYFAKFLLRFYKRYRILGIESEKEETLRQIDKSLKDLTAKYKKHKIIA